MTNRACTRGATLPIQLMPLLALLLSGCMGGVTTPANKKEVDSREAMLNSLMGSSKELVEMTLGKPTCQFLGPQKTYWVNRRPRKEKTMGIGFFVIPYPVWGIEADTCTLLEFDNSDHLVSYRTDYPYAGFLGFEPQVKEYCMGQLFSEDERLQLARTHDEEIRMRGIKTWPSNCSYSAPRN